MCLSSWDHTVRSLYINFSVIYPQPLFSSLQFLKNINSVSIVLLCNFFSVFHVTLGIHRCVWGPPQGLGEQELGGRPLSWSRSRLPLYFTNKTAPHLTNFYIGLLYKFLLEKGSQAYPDLKLITGEPSFTWLFHICCISSFSVV